MPRGNWEKLSLNHPPPPAVVHTKFFTGNHPETHPSPPPTIGCLPRPPKEKRRHKKQKTQTPPFEKQLHTCC